MVVSKATKAFGIIGVAAALCFAQESTDIVSDSLKMELKKIEMKLELHEKSEHSAPLKTTAVSTEHKALSSPTMGQVKRLSRKPGIGGGGGLTIGFKVVDMEALTESVKYDLARKGDKSGYAKLGVVEKLDDDYQTIGMFGAQGLVGIGDGIRLGVGVYGGGRHYRLWHAENDSAYSMVTWLGYGGFIVEKAISFEKTNVVFGGLIGAGSQGLSVWNSDRENYANSSDTLDNDDFIGDYAGFFAGEIRAGVTHSFLPWLHLGVEANGAVFASGSGFKKGDSFGSFSPGGNIRLMFGRVS